MQPGRYPPGPAGNIPGVTALAAPAVAPAPVRTQAPLRRRIASLDVLRGLTIVGMLLVNNAGDKRHYPAQLVHTPWNGLDLADVIFPLFLFAIGTSMPFSRRAQEPRRALRRVGLLALIGVLLVDAKYRSPISPTGVLQMIAVAYLIAWAISRLPRRRQWLAAGGLFGGLLVAGLAGGWAEGTTTAEAVDRFVLGSPSAQGVFPMLGASLNILAGLAAGRVFREFRGGRSTVRRLVAMGGVTGVAGLALMTVVPPNKHVWSPTYILLTVAVSFLLMAVAFQVVDRWGTSAWWRPLIVLGANALAVYAGSYLIVSALLRDLKPRLVAPLARFGGSPEFGAIAFAVLTVLVAWAACEVLFRRRIFLKV